jgi:hypothetical protein
MLTIASLVLGVVAWKICASYIGAQNAARAQTQTFVNAVEAHVSHSMKLERFQPDCAVDPGRFARGTALRLLAMARHVASTRLVPQANRLGLASHSQTESALADLSLMGFSNAIKATSAKGISSAEAIQKLLSSHGPEMKADFWILFLDANGMGVAATTKLPVQGVAHADRDYFQAHRTPNAEVFVSRPFIGRTSK